MPRKNRKQPRPSNRNSNRRRGGKPQGRPQGRGDRPSGGAPRGPGGFVKAKGIVDKNRKGFAFVAFDRKDLEDAFVPPREAQGLFHGDRVEAALHKNGEVLSIRVIEHRVKEVVGRYTPHPAGWARGGWVVFERKRAREEIFVQQPLKDAKPGDWVRISLEFHERGPFPFTGKVIQIFGAQLPASADVEMIANEYGLVEAHTDTAVREAKSLRLNLPGPSRDTQGRTDLSALPLITIDGETARDFDDAVFVEKQGGAFTLWVAIADVSHYVTEGSALDKEAFSRGTSVYFPERAFHMLPHALSEGLCSLKPNEPRLALVAKMRISPNGKVESTQVIEAIIRSKRRATYTEIAAEWAQWKAQGSPAGGWAYEAQAELYQILRQARLKRGSIDFDLPEAEVVVDPGGEVVSIKNRSRNDAHRLIEEFMIAANESVTEWMLKRRLPFLYRVHDEPARQALEKFAQLAAGVGLRIDLRENVPPKVLADIVSRLDGHPAQLLLNTALLRSMKQAVYSSIHGIHYGLASTAYTHFTSPIRRYPDLVVHRLLRQVVRAEKAGGRALSKPEIDRLERELAEIAEHCSYRERIATAADREALRLKQVRAMAARLGDEFDGKIIGMAESGFFVQLTDPFCEGMVPKDSLTDDLYSFNEERMVFAGRRKKRTFKMGEVVRVRVVRADLDRRQTDFALI